MDPNSSGVRFTKFATKITVGIGAGKIAADVIANNTRVPTTKIDKITMWAGGFVIGMMFSEAVEKYALKTIDEIIEQVNELRGITVEDTPAS
jgi:hypothetical protein